MRTCLERVIRDRRHRFSVVYGRNHDIGVGTGTDADKCAGTVTVGGKRKTFAVGRFDRCAAVLGKRTVGTIDGIITGFRIPIHIDIGNTEELRKLNDDIGRPIKVDSAKEEIDIPVLLDRSVITDLGQASAARKYACADDPYARGQFHAFEARA